MCTITTSIKCVQMFSAVLQEEFRYMHYVVHFYAVILIV